MQGGLRASGMTLIEIVIVVITLALLAAVAAPTIATAREDATKALLDTQWREVNRAVSTYRWTHRGEIPRLGRSENDPIGWGDLARTELLAKPPINPYVGSMIVESGTPSLAAAFAPGDGIGWIWWAEGPQVLPAGYDVESGLLFHERPIR